MKKTEKIRSLQREIENYRKNLLLIEERESEYVRSVDIPLQLIKEKREKEKKLAELSEKLEQLENQNELIKRKTSKPIPPLLPYSINCDLQLKAFDWRLTDFRQGHKPKLFLVHGNDHQCLEKFIERLEGKFRKKCKK